MVDDRGMWQRSHTRSHKEPSFASSSLVLLADRTGHWAHALGICAGSSKVKLNNKCGAISHRPRMSFSPVSSTNSPPVSHKLSPLSLSTFVGHRIYTLLQEHEPFIVFYCPVNSSHWFSNTEPTTLHIQPCLASRYYQQACWRPEQLD